MEKVNDKCRNVTFFVPENLIKDIDDFCKKNGGLKRKEWFFNLLKEKNELEIEVETLSFELKKRNNDFSSCVFELKNTIDNLSQIESKHNELDKTYRELFTSTLRYRTFFRRLKNLFVKF